MITSLEIRDYITLASVLPLNILHHLSVVTIQYFHAHSETLDNAS